MARARRNASIAASRRAAGSAGARVTPSPPPIPRAATCSLAPQRARRAAEQPLKRLVEAPDAAEAGGERDLGHRQARLVDELLGEQHAPRLRHRDRRGAEMLLEQAAQLPLADAQPRGQRVDARLVAVERAFRDQREAARHRVGGAAPGAEVRRRLGPAAQAGPEPRLLRRRRRREEPAILELRRAAPDRPAGNRCPVEVTPTNRRPSKRGVAGLERAVAESRIEVSMPGSCHAPLARRSRFSDMVP